MNEAPAPIHLSLVSHTNVGKTTLARTLLGRDVGEVRDAPHVTEFADAHEMLRTPQGDALQLWDTPGFGDSARLLKRMRASGNPIGWFMGQVWDRWRDRPFWASQQALRHVVERSDLVLYLVSAAEEPAGAGYVASEMDLLTWVDKPVIVLLNQLGAPREPAVEAAEVARWREHLARWPLVREVLPMDAFARCWVQEFVLLDAIEAALPCARRASMQRLSAGWRATRRATYDASVDLLAHSLARLGAARQELADHAGLRAKLRGLGAALGLAAHEKNPTTLAQAALAAALDEEVRSSTAQLIALHGLEGAAQGEILAQCARRSADARWGNKIGAAAAVYPPFGGDVLHGFLTGGSSQAPVCLEPGRLIGHITVTSAEPDAVARLTEVLPGLLEFAGVSGALVGPGVESLLREDLVRSRIAEVVMRFSCSLAARSVRKRW